MNAILSLFTIHRYTHVYSEKKTHSFKIVSLLWIFISRKISITNAVEVENTSFKGVHTDGRNWFKKREMQNQLHQVLNVQMHTHIYV